MHGFRWTSCLILTIGAVALGQPPEPRPADPAESQTLTGRVVNVYRAKEDRQDDESDSLFVIELLPEAVAKKDPKTGDKTVFIKTWRLNRLPKGPDEADGQIEIPARNDVVDCDVTGGPVVFDAQVPRGIRIVSKALRKSRSTGLELLRVDAGEYLMGDIGRRVDAYPHLVKITKPYYLGVYEITQGEYQFVMKAKPSSFSFRGSSKDKIGRLITDRFPVENVSWFDAVEFCNRLSKLDGLEPYYELTDPSQQGDSIVSATVTTTAGRGYRLPTEAEWEYACRAGTVTPFHYGNKSSSKLANLKIQTDAGFYGAPGKIEELGRTAKVGSYPPNPWGFYDMHGNVGEWCQDWYDKDYGTETPVKDPKGPVTGTHRVLRGGSWMMNDGNCRSDSRFFMAPGEVKFYGGFRIARNP